MIALYILGALVVLIAFIAVIASFRPDEFSVSRSATIAAPPAAVFVQVNDLHNWEAWSPWAKLDPAAKNSYEGPRAGVGAAFSWCGNFNIGEGRMTITQSRPNELVVFRLEFVKPMKGTNVAEFTFKPEGTETKVSWTMSGKYGFMAKVFGLFMSCEKMVGGQFEQGLASMKSIAEAAA